MSRSGPHAPTNIMATQKIELESGTAADSDRGYFQDSAAEFSNNIKYLNLPS